MSDFDYDFWSDSVTSDSDSESDWEPENKKRKTVNQKRKAVNVDDKCAQNLDVGDDIFLYDDTDTESPDQAEVVKERQNPKNSKP